MQRLNKVIAQSGICSRRKADILIKEGLIKVNNVVVKELGFMVKKSDLILYNDKPLEKEELVYYIMNKPRNIISSASDEKNRKTVIDIAKENNIKERLVPVGRLDYNTAGLIILTNDGNLVNKITHPKNEIEKEYVLRIDTILDKNLIKKLNTQKHVFFEEKKYNFKNIYVEEINKEYKTSLLKIILTEGKNHEVKNIFKSLNAKVLKLTRTRINTITIDNLGKGNIRKLKIKEIKDLKNI